MSQPKPEQDKQPQGGTNPPDRPIDPVPVASTAPTPAKPPPAARPRRRMSKAMMIALIGAGASIAGPLLVMFFPILIQKCSMPPEPSTVTLDRICELEQSLQFLPTDGPAKCETLLDYFRAANPELFAHVDLLISRAKANAEDHRGATYVSGAPGVGKSFVVSDDETFGNSAVVIKLKERPELWASAGFPLENLPELVRQDDQREINKMLGLREPSNFSLEKLINTALGENQPLPPLVILDGLDELHPKTVRRVLQEVERLLRERKYGGRFLHVLVFGRPEAFGRWLRDSARQSAKGLLIRQFTIEGPEFETTGDLARLCQAYLDYKGLSAPDGSLAERLRALIVAHPYLSYSMSNLATANFLVERMRLNQDKFSDRALRTVIYDDLLRRNHDKTSRPQQHVGDYGHALEEVAIKYSGELDADGCFTVTFEDRVVFESETGGKATFSVRELLDNSGLVTLQPNDTSTTLYRFEPLWVQAHLVERWNERMCPGHSYVACAAP